MYGSIPKNETFYVNEGQQLSIYYNPRDTLTNFTVNWFRSTTGEYTEAEEINMVPNEYTIREMERSGSERSNTVNCTTSMYRDSFFLVIHQFNSIKDGYYWCQITINNSYLQPSQGAWYIATSLSADQGYSIMMVSTTETQCIGYYQGDSIRSTSSPMDPYSTSKLTMVDSASNMVPALYYVIGVLSILAITSGSLLALARVLPCVHKSQKKRKDKNKDKPTPFAASTMNDRVGLHQEDHDTL